MQIPRKINIIFIFIFFYLSLGCALDKSIPNSDYDPEIYCCYMDPRVEELYIFANQEKDTKIAREVLEKLLEVRPNCIDVYRSLSFVAAIENNLVEFQKMDYKSKAMETEYKLRTGKVFTELNKTAISQKQKPVIYKNPPPKKDRINYWKWIYIYERLRK